VGKKQWIAGRRGAVYLGKVGEKKDGDLRECARNTSTGEVGNKGTYQPKRRGQSALKKSPERGGKSVHRGC